MDKKQKDDAFAQIKREDLYKFMKKVETIKHTQTAQKDIVDMTSCRTVDYSCNSSKCDFGSALAEIAKTEPTTVHDMAMEIDKNQISFFAQILDGYVFTKNGKAVLHMRNTTPVSTSMPGYTTIVDINDVDRLAVPKVSETRTQMSIEASNSAILGLIMVALAVRLLK